jgi:hypothetical protein
VGHRTHAGALCRAGHLTHRTLHDARRCDADTAELNALIRFERFRQRLSFRGWVEVGSWYLAYATAFAAKQAMKLVSWAAEDPK